MERDQKNGENPHQKLRMGVAGCGRVFEAYHLPALMRSKDWDLAAVCEPLEERRKWIESQIHGVSLFKDFDIFLLQSPFDALLITTPPATHYDLALKALERGQHLLVEKPMALNREEARSMMEKSIGTHKNLWVSFNRRFHSPYKVLKEKLAAHSTADPFTIRFQLIIDPNSWNSVTHYLGEESQGGGVLDDVASHQIDLLGWLIEKPVQAVRAESIDTGEPGTKSFQYKLKFQNGPTAECVAGHGKTYSEYIEIEWSKKKWLTYPAGVVESSFFSDRWIRNYCSFRASLHFLIHKLMARPNFTVQSFENQLASFAAAIRGKKSKEGANAKAGSDCIQVIQACRMSVESGGDWISVTE